MSELNCSIVESELTEKVDNLKLIENMKNYIKGARLLIANCYIV